MSSRYGQVALLYVRQAVSGAQAVLLAALTLLGVVLELVTPRRQDALPFLFLALYGVAVVMSCLKQQVIVARSQLLPRPLTPHLVVGGVLAGLLVLGFPALGALRLATPTWGWAGAIMTMTSLVAWWAVHPSWVVTAITMVLYFLPLSSPTQPFVIALLRGQHETLGQWLVTGACVGFASTLGWLSRLNEEHPQFHTRLGRSQTTGSVTTAVADAQVWRNVEWWVRWGDASERQMASWRQWAQASTWQRTRLVQAGLGNMNLLGAALIGAVCLLSFDWTIGFQLRQPAGGMVRAFPLAITGAWISFLPVMLVAAPFLKSDALLTRFWLSPMSRQRWAREVGLCLILRMFAAWVGCWLGVLVYTLVSHGGSLAWTLLARYVMLTSAGLLLQFGITLWCMSWRSMAAFMLTMLWCYAIGIGAGVLAGWQAITGPICAGWCAALTLLGAVVIRSAYRRWLQVELGAG